MIKKLEMVSLTTPLLSFYSDAIQVNTRDESAWLLDDLTANEYYETRTRDHEFSKPRNNNLKTLAHFVASLQVSDS